jgi:hydroxyacylglutathione hydrolase
VIKSRVSVPQVVVVKVCHEWFKNFSYVVIDPASKKAVIVDPAWEMAKIHKVISDAQAEPCGVLITHSHFDHTHLAAPVAEQYCCPIWMAQEEIAASGFRAKRLRAVPASVWTIGEMAIEAIFTPGHTPGSTCFLIGDALFSGDVLFAEGCGMCSDLQAANAMYDSLAELKRRTRLETRIFPGHSYGEPPGQMFAHLLKNNIYLQFPNRAMFAAYRLRKGQDRAKMFRFV